MEWHMNDLSIDGQFRTPDELKQVLEPLLRLRHRNPQFRNSFFISNLLHERPAVSGQSLQQSIFINSNRDFRSLASSWLSSGPFWNDTVCLHQDNYFEYDGNDVTEQGLGEATRRQISGTDVTAFSLTGTSTRFEKTPLSVQHGLKESPYGHHDIHNLWDDQELSTAILQARPNAQNWQEFFEQIKADFSEDLIFSDDALDELLPHPFKSAFCNKARLLLIVLSELARERDASGAWTNVGRQKYESYFVGENPQFVSESDPNNNLFFVDPVNSQRKIHCTWHGRMPSGLGRLHFEWPIPLGQRKIKVVYIGTKVNKW